MTHSHIPLQHLLKQVEVYCENRSQRDVRPDWLVEFIDGVADLFEPFSGVGRVGYDCRLSEDCWIVGTYLGKTEFVGGKDDGQTVPANFQFNVQGLLQLFTDVVELTWSAHPATEKAAAQSGRSLLTVTGLVDRDKQVRLSVFSAPPEDAGPGLRQYDDGQIVPV